MSSDVRVWINGVPLDDVTRVTITPVEFDTEPLYAHDGGEYLTVLQGGVYEVSADLTPFAGQRIAELSGTRLREAGFPSAFDHRYRQRQRNRAKRKNRRRR